MKEAINIKEERCRKINDKLMVGISPSPYSEYLIRRTKELSIKFNSEWIAVYVGQPEALTEKESGILNENLKLARELGGKVVITADDDIVSGLIRIAEKNDVFRIIVGKPLRKSLMRIIFGMDFIDRLIKQSREIEIFIVSAPGVRTKRRKIILPKFNVRRNLKEYLISVLAILSVTLLNFLLLKIIDYWTIGLIYLAAVSMLAVFLTRWPVLIAAVLSALVWDFIFIPPLFTFYIGKTKDSLMLIMYFIIAIITGNLTSKLRLKEIFIRKREKSITELYEISNIISNSKNLEEIIERSSGIIEKIFNAKVSVILINEKGNLNEKPHGSSNFKLNEKAFKRALSAFENKKNEVHSGDDSLIPDSIFIPLIAPGGAVGVLGINFIGNFKLDIEHEDMLLAFSRQLAIAVERELLSEMNKKVMIAAESEKLYKIILNSISHELRTPVTAISIAAAGLADDIMLDDPETKKILCEDIIDSTKRLNRVVGNLLDIARLESGKLKLNLQWHDVNDLVNAVVQKNQKELSLHQFDKDIQNNVPMILIDFTLMEQVLDNLLYNAVVHSGEHSRISLKIFGNDENIFIAVKDNGSGIDEADAEKIFDKFYKSKYSKTGGIGLGLSICKSIVEIHNGSIIAENNSEGGASITVSLPLNHIKEQ
jgi:two-component system sensor histidine kinase KdpD